MTSLGIKTNIATFILDELNIPCSSPSQQTPELYNGVKYKRLLCRGVCTSGKRLNLIYVLTVNRVSNTFRALQLKINL